MLSRLRWKEVRRLIAVTAGQELTSLGFKNPGYKMYRYRKHYIDIIQFYPNKYHSSFTVEFGSHPRQDKTMKGNKNCWHFIFRGRLRNNRGRELWFDVPPTERENKEQLYGLSGQLMDSAQLFFSNFEELQDGLEALNFKAKHMEALFLPPPIGCSTYNQFLRTFELLMNGNEL